MNLVNRAFQSIISAGQDFLREEPKVQLAKITGAAGGALAMYAASCAGIEIVRTSVWNQPRQIDDIEAMWLAGKAVIGTSMVVMELVMTERIPEFIDSLKITFETSYLTID